RMEGAILGRQILDRAQRETLRLDRQHQARAHRLAVELDGAGAADAVLAADMGAGQARLMADEVRQQQARLDLAVVGLAVDLDRHSTGIHAAASSTARLTIASISRFRYSPEPWMSPVGSISRTAIFAVSRANSSLITCPSSACSASRARSGTSAAASRTMRAAEQRSPSPFV